MDFSLSDVLNDLTTKVSASSFPTPHSDRPIPYPCVVSLLNDPKSPPSWERLSTALGKDFGKSFSQARFYKGWNGLSAVVEAFKRVRWSENNEEKKKEGFDAMIKLSTLVNAVENTINHATQRNTSASPEAENLQQRGQRAISQLGSTSPLTAVDSDSGQGTGAVGVSSDHRDQIRGENEAIIKTEDKGQLQVKNAKPNGSSIMSQALAITNRATMMSANSHTSPVNSLKRPSNDPQSGSKPKARKISHPPTTGATLEFSPAHPLSKSAQAKKDNVQIHKDLMEFYRSWKFEEGDELERKRLATEERNVEPYYPKPYTYTCDGCIEKKLPCMTPSTFDRMACTGCKSGKRGCKYNENSRNAKVGMSRGDTPFDKSKLRPWSGHHDYMEGDDSRNDIDFHRTSQVHSQTRKSKEKVKDIGANEEVIIEKNTSVWKGVLNVDPNGGSAMSSWVASGVGVTYLKKSRPVEGEAVKLRLLILEETELDDEEVISNIFVRGDRAFKVEKQDITFPVLDVDGENSNVKHLLMRFDDEAEAQSFHDALQKELEVPKKE